MQVTTRNGRRWSTAAAYLKLPNVRDSVKIVTGALAKRVLVEGGRAVGVEYAVGGQTYTTRAKGEVILCGGAFNSPQLLQLSGIGPAENLLKEDERSGCARIARGGRESSGPLWNWSRISLPEACHGQRHRQQLLDTHGGDDALPAFPFRTYG